MEESGAGHTAAARLPGSAAPIADATHRWLLAGGVVVATALALWMVWPAFAPGRIINLDAPRHLLRAYVMTKQFLPAGHVDGLSHWWYLGAQLFLFQSYGYFFLIGATSLVLSTWLHVATIDGVFKFWYVLPILLLPGSVALLARRLGVSGRGAVAAALASLIFTSPLGYGVQGMFGIGLLLQGAGVIAFALAWPEILAVLIEPSRAPWRAILATAAVVLCHFISGAYTLAAAGFAAAGLAAARRSPRPLLRYALVAALVLLLAGHSLFPSLELHSLSGQSVGWGTERDRFWRVLRGTLFGEPILALPALAAAVWAIFRGGTALRISALVFFGTALAGGANEQPWMPPELESLIQTLLRPRALPYAALFQAVFAGVAIDRLLAGVESLAGRIGRPSPARWMFVATPAALALMLFIGSDEIHSQRRFVRTESTLNKADRTVYLKLVSWLHKNVRPPAILAVPRTVLPQSAVGARSVISFLNLDTKLYTLLGDQAELVRSAKHAGRVDLDRIGTMASRFAPVLRSAGVSYVIISDPGAREKLIGNKDFELAFEYEQALRTVKKSHGERRKKPIGVAVYRLRGGGQWLRGSGIDVTEMRHKPEHFAWDITVEPGKPMRTATAAVNWHPNWKARADGEPVATHITPARRVQLEVPESATHVTLDFERSPREKLWNWLSLATLAGVVIAWWRSARARRVRAATDSRSSA